MNFKKHCDLCDYQQLSLKEGSICELTNKKPKFDKTCSKMFFKDKLKSILLEVLNEYEYLKQLKTKKHKNYILGLTFGILIVLIGFFSWRFFLNKNLSISVLYFKFLFTIPVLILAVGFTIIKNTFNGLKSYKTKFYSIQKRKDNIDEVLNLYKKKYEYQILTLEEYHGINEVICKIKIH